MMTYEFSLAGYEALLAAFAKRGYSVVDFDAVDPAERHLVLHHDVDLSIDYAVRMAEVEHRMGVSAWYFTLLRSDLYNPLSSDGLRGLRRLTILGHKVGLHFDASLYAQDRDSLDAAARNECAVLETMLRAPVRVISFHRPAPALLGMPGDFAGRLHTYAPKFFKEIGYCSDSQGRFRYGPPLDHEAVAAGRAFHLLTHPVWWCGQPDETTIGKLQRFLEEQKRACEMALAANIIPYAEHLAHNRRTPAIDG